MSALAPEDRVRRLQNHIVNQSRCPNVGGHGNQSRTLDLFDGIERVGIDNFKVVQPDKRFPREDLTRGIDKSRRASLSRAKFFLDTIE
jgi:hypothetical protein